MSWGIGPSQRVGEAHTLMSPRRLRSRRLLCVLVFRLCFVFLPIYTLFHRRPTLVDLIHLPQRKELARLVSDPDLEP